jgi:hypothetical protein
MSKKGETHQNGLEGYTRPRQMTTKMTSTMTITFTRTDEYILDFEEWYAHKKGEFKSEAVAIKQWEAMCEDVSAEEIYNDTPFGWDEVEDRCDEIQSENEVCGITPAMEAVLDTIEEAFESIGVSFLRNHSCCNTCGHEEAPQDNYVFYHNQNHADLNKGDTTVCLAFCFTEEKKPEVLSMIEAYSDKLFWEGNEDTKIFLTCDPAEMAKHVKEMAERRAFLTAKAKEAKRAELLRQLALLDAE